MVTQRVRAVNGGLRARTSTSPQRDSDETDVTLTGSSLGEKAKVRA